MPGHCLPSKTPGINSKGLQTKVCGICSSNNLVRVGTVPTGNLEDVLYKTQIFLFWKSSETVLNLTPLAGYRNDQIHNGAPLSENIYS
jgi:hypothetical protein